MKIAKRKWWGAENELEKGVQPGGRQATGEVLQLRLCRLSHEEVGFACLALRSASSWGSWWTQMPLQLRWEGVAKNQFRKPEKSLADGSRSREDRVCSLLSPKTCRGTSRVPSPPPERSSWRCCAAPAGVFPSHGSLQPWSFALASRLGFYTPFFFCLACLVFVAPLPWSGVTWIQCRNWRDYLEVIHIT